MSNRLTVKHAVVGSAIAVYGVPDQLSTLVVSPAELPECDILDWTARGRRP